MFKKGDKVRCIDNAGLSTDLTLGIVYTAERMTDDHVVVFDDCGDYGYYLKRRFELVEKIEYKPYIVPEYIVKCKRRLKVLNDVLKTCKKNSKYAHRRIGYSSLFHSKIQPFRREAVLIQTILRQHNEMKRMFAKMRG